jgi:hypothetical protein
LTGEGRINKDNDGEYYKPEEKEKFTKIVFSQNPEIAKELRDIHRAINYLNFLISLIVVYILFFFKSG